MSENQASGGIADRAGIPGSSPSGRSAPLPGAIPTPKTRTLVRGRWIPRQRAAFRDITLAELGTAALADYNLVRAALEARTTFREKTRQTYLIHVKQLLWWLQQQRLRIDELTAPMLNEFLSEFKDRSNSYKIQGRAALGHAIEVFSQNQRLNETAKLWLEKIGTTRIPLKPIKYLTSDEMRRLFQVLKNLKMGGLRGMREYAVFSLLLSLGVRIGEILNLSDKAIELDENNELSSLQFEQKGGRAKVVPLKDEKGKLTEVGKTVRDWLNFRRSVRTDITQLRRFRRTKEWAKSEYLFSSQRGRPLTYRVIQRRLPELAKLANIHRHIHPHMLRHSYAMFMRNKGVALDTIQQLMNHADIKSTQRYVTPLEREVAEAQAQIDSFVGEGIHA